MNFLEFPAIGSIQVSEVLAFLVLGIVGVFIVIWVARWLDGALNGN